MGLGIEDNAVIVTGARRRLGAAIVQALTAEGAQVLAAACSGDASAQAAAPAPDRIEALPGEWARLRKIPARRVGRPAEIGPHSCNLVSPLSDLVTGSCFVTDGGEVARP